MGCSAPESNATPEVATSQPAERHERSLPRFQGKLLGGGRASTDLLRRKRGIVYLFSSSDPEADVVAGMLSRLLDQASAANIALLGVSRDREASLAEAFVRRQKFDFPVFLDADGSISRQLGIPTGSSSLLLVDSEGFVIGGFTRLDRGIPDAAQAYEEEIRRVLRLPQLDEPITRAFGALSEAPDFSIQASDGETLTRSDFKGQALVLVFFSPTCPHCRQFLQFLDGLVKKLDNDSLAALSVSVSNRKYVIEDMVEKLEIDLPMYVDPDRFTQHAYGHSHIVPEIFIIDREGRVVGRHDGSDARTEAIIRMEVRGILGVENPLLLDRVGYSGVETCRTCHRSQHQTWTLTNHAYAFDTLVEHGADRDPECLPCHTVGWEKPGGYSLSSPHSHLEGVQCESCHGRGGPHQSPEFAAADGGLEGVCVGCHNTTHSLNFVFAERLPDVSHSMNLRFASLSVEEREALLKRRDKRERNLFQDGSYLGSAACQSCHAKEYQVWSQSAHAKAFTTLERKSAHAKEDCQRCHTTGFEKPGGFPAGGPALHHVGCESCHGPGEEHAREGSSKRGSILALADKCDSCVILQICGSCHDDQNDPGFEFEVLDKIDLIRHGSPGSRSASR